MSRHHIIRESKVQRSPRVIQIESLFDIPKASNSKNEWHINVPIQEKPWNIGLIVGPSGSGKTSVATDLFKNQIIEDFKWSDKAIIDNFPDNLSTKRIVNVLSKVGFSTPPAWLRPFSTLSNGEKFRTTMARAILETEKFKKKPIVIDEFTSVIDRQIAKVACHTTQKLIRKENRKFIGIACHYDIIDWLQPDWILDMMDLKFTWRSLRPRPKFKIEIRQCNKPKEIWKVFARHHYMNHSLAGSAKAFIAFINNIPIAFNSYIHFPHPSRKARNIKRGHRLVVMPDWQGLGIGPWFDEWLGEYLYNQSLRYHNTTAHPTMIKYYNQSPRWKLLAKGAGNLKSGTNANKSLAKTQRKKRRMSTVTFSYQPPKKTTKEEK